MSMLHDNELLRYTVDLPRKCITLDTEYWIQDVCEKTTVTFEGVCAHRFSEAGEMATILFDITAHPIERFVSDCAELLRDTKNYGWPFSYQDEGDLLARLQSRHLQYFCIDSSCGMEGLVLAESMQLHTQNVR